MKIIDGGQRADIAALTKQLWQTKLSTGLTIIETAAFIADHLLYDENMDPLAIIPALHQVGLFCNHDVEDEDGRGQLVILDEALFRLKLPQYVPLLPLLTKLPGIPLPLWSAPPKPTPAVRTPTVIPPYIKRIK